MHKQIGQVREYLKKHKIPVATKPKFPSFARLVKITTEQSRNAAELNKAILERKMDEVQMHAVNSLYSLLNAITELGIWPKLEEKFDVYHRNEMMTIQADKKWAKERKKRKKAIQAESVAETLESMDKQIDIPEIPSDPFDPFQ